MARVLLVFGDPGNGKSTLAGKLSATHRFEVVSVDDVYVDWVKSRCPRLYFDDLDKHILQHYRFILAGHPDLVAKWHSHLLAFIIECSQNHDRVVVEGYLLFDCKDVYENELTKRSAQVFQIYAENCVYSQIARLTIEQIASLGGPE